MASKKKPKKSPPVKKKVAKGVKDVKKGQARKVEPVKAKKPVKATPRRKGGAKPVKGVGKAKPDRPVGKAKPVRGKPAKPVSGKVDNANSRKGSAKAKPVRHTDNGKKSRTNPGKPVKPNHASRVRPVRETGKTSKRALPGKGPSKSAKKPSKPDTGKRSKPVTKPAKPTPKRSKGHGGKPKPPRSKGIGGGVKGKALPAPPQRVKRAGFASIRETQAAEVAQGVKVIFDKAKAKMGGAVFVFANRDGTVDGLWRIPMPRSADLINQALKIEESLKGNLDNRAWISLGVIFPPNQPKVGEYDKWQGLNVVQSYAQHYHRTTDKSGKPRGGKHRTFATLRQIIKNLAAAKRRKAQYLTVKIHWNADDTKPTREDI